MKLFDIYGWALPTQTELLAPYRENEQMTRLVKHYWLGLQSEALWFVIISVVLFAVLFVIYYWPFNNKPGRHYKWRYWCAFLGILSGCVFAFTLIVCAFIKCPVSGIWWKTSLMLALINTLYSLLLYTLSSFILCQIPPTVSKTNAYPFMKIKRK